MIQSKNEVIALPLHFLAFVISRFLPALCEPVVAISSVLLLMGVSHPKRNEDDTSGGNRKLRVHPLLSP